MKKLVNVHVNLVNKKGEKMNHFWIVEINVDKMFFGPFGDYQFAKNWADNHSYETGHFEIAREVLKAGKHLLVEKPSVLSLEVSIE